MLYAAADREDRWHAASVAFLAEDNVAMVVPAPVVTEAAWMIGANLGSQAEAAFVTSIATGGLEVADLDDVGYRRCGELVDRYADLPLGFVDAAGITVAEQGDAGTVATVDRRHFTIVRPAHVHAFRLVPATAGTDG